MERPYFEPYIGKHALTEGFKGKRLLIIGDSHYCGYCDKCGVHGMSNPLEMEDCIFFTQGVMEKYAKYRAGAPLEGNDRFWYTTYLVCERAVMGSRYTNDTECEYYLDHILFCNFIQAAYLDNPNDNYTYEDYQFSFPIIKDLILKYKPERVIVWGNPVWITFPGGENSGWIPIDANSGYYNWDGHEFKILKIHHPAKFFSYDKHIEMIADFLK